MTPAELCKAVGLKSLAELAEIDMLTSLNVKYLWFNYL
jgi:hypothetical protein